MTVKISKPKTPGEPKPKRTGAPGTAVPVEPTEKKLHAWIDGSKGGDRWHYCEVCRTVRHPNGKIDEQACPGPYKRSKPAPKKVSPVSTAGPLGSAAPITSSFGGGVKVTPGGAAPKGAAAPTSAKPQKTSSPAAHAPKGEV